MTFYGVWNGEFKKKKEHILISASNMVNGQTSFKCVTRSIAATVTVDMELITDKN